jgi:hypothetical protein
MDCTFQAGLTAFYNTTGQPVQGFEGFNASLLYDKASFTESDPTNTTWGELATFATILFAAYKPKFVANLGLSILKSICGCSSKKNTNPSVWVEIKFDDLAKMSDADRAKFLTIQMSASDVLDVPEKTQELRDTLSAANNPIRFTIQGDCQTTSKAAFAALKEVEETE